MNLVDYLNLGFAICIGLLSWVFTIKYYRNTKFGERFMMGLNPKVLKLIGITSTALLLLLMVDEVGLLLNEWGINFVLFDFTRRFISIPGIAHLVYLANLYVATYAAKEMSRKFLTEYTDDETTLEAGSNTRAIQVMALSLLMMTVQLTLYETYSANLTAVSKVIFYCVFIVILVVPPIMMLIKSVFMTKENIDSSKKKGYGWLIILFVSLTQTMITKVIVIYNTILGIKNKLSEKKSDKEDILLLDSSLALKNVLANINADKVQ